MNGALEKVTGFHSHLARQALYEVTQETLVNFNDNPRTTHGQVMRAFDEAIAIQKKVIKA